MGQAVDAAGKALTSEAAVNLTPVPSTLASRSWTGPATSRSFGPWTLS